MRRTVLLASVLLLAASPAGAGDWPSWRGPLDNGYSPEKGLPETFDHTTGKNVIWKAPIGGRTTPIIQKGRMYFLAGVGEGQKEQEAVVCLDANTGAKLWTKTFNVFFADIVSDRLGWTVMVGDPETDTVFAHGTQGNLYCLDRDGKVVWERQLTEEFGRVSGYGGRVTSPIVDGDLLILSMANSSYGNQGFGGVRLVAFDKRTGKVIWWGETGHRVKNTYFSVPVVAVINGERLVITGGGDGGVHAFRVRTGEKVWSLIIGEDAVNCSPVVDGNYIYIGHGEGNPDGGAQGRLVCIDGSKVTNGTPEVVWKKDGIRVKFASPILHEGRLYFCNDFGRLYCYDARTGKQHWVFLYGKNTMGSPVLADGKIYIGAVDGRFSILKPEEKKCTKLHVEEFPPQGGSDDEINGSPAVANGKVYFQTAFATYCIGDKENAAKPDALPPSTNKEEPVPADAKPAHIQVVPADVTLQPGDSVDLKALAYDAKGRLIGPVKVDWAAAPYRWPPLAPVPMGGVPMIPPLKANVAPTAGETTKLSIPAEATPQVGEVHAKLGELTGYVRVRVVFKLPYTADFSKVPDGRPLPWVNSAGKFVTATAPDGSKAIRKTNVNANALVARAYTYMGLSEMKDYTIEAEVLGTKVDTDTPDIGIVAQRYSLVMMGNARDLRLQSWEALPRISKTMAFNYQPNTWYKMKLTTEKVEGGLKVKGKVWPANMPEPEKWLLEVVDPVPNLEGTPGIYGNAAGITATQPGSEAFYKNIKVTPNGK